MTKTLIIAIFILSSVFVLTSCGKTGDLVRPTAIAPDVHAVKHIAIVQH